MNLVGFRKPELMLLHIMLFAVYTEMLLYITLFAFNYPANGYVSIVPFKNIFTYLLNGGPPMLLNVAGNILLFIPLGYFVALFVTKNKFSEK